MRLLEAFKRPALAVVGTTPPERSDRASLKAAISARDAAQQAVIDARKTPERLQAVIDEADNAARAAADATRAANEARQRWIESGCNFSTAREHHALTEAATEAAQNAEHAAADAKAVARELARAQSVVESAQSDLRERESAIGTEIGQIIVEEESALRERYLQAADDYRALRVQLMALHSVLDPWRVYKDAAAPTREGARLIDQALERGRIVNWDAWDASHASTRVRDEEPAADNPMVMFEQCVARWRARAAQLRANPDAE